MENEFIQKFPELDILFITEDHGLSLPEFIYEINRNEYAAYELFDKDWWGTYLIDSTDLAPIAEFWNDSWSDLTWDDFDLGEFEPLKWDDFELDDSLVEVHELEVPVRTIIYSDNEGTGFMAIAA